MHALVCWGGVCPGILQRQDICGVLGVSDDHMSHLPRLVLRGPGVWPGPVLGPVLGSGLVCGRGLVFGWVFGQVLGQVFSLVRRGLDLWPYLSGAQGTWSV